MKSWEKEEQQIGRIKELKKLKMKEMSKERAEINRIHIKAPGPKRRKLEDASFQTITPRDAEPGEKLETGTSEKRKSEAEHQPQSKKSRQTRMDQFWPGETEEKNRDAYDEEEKRDAPDNYTNTTTNQADALPPTPGVYYGEEAEVELIDWEEIFYKHI